MTARSPLVSRSPLVAVALVGALAGTSLLAQEANDEARGASTDSAEGTLPDDALALVNGRPVPALSLENVVRQLDAQGREEADRERILDELIDLEILAQEAEKSALDEQPEIAAALRLQYTQTMANAYLAATSDRMEVSEEDLRAEYERQTAGMAREEFRASHILLENEAEAQAVIDELAEGAEFDALARERSIDPSGQTGGELGWFQAEAMVPEFTAAVATMDPGTTSTAPVESEFGWHVIRLDDRRGVPLPDYDSAKPGLTSLVLRERLAEEVRKLREAADVQR